MDKEESDEFLDNLEAIGNIRNEEQKVDEKLSVLPHKRRK